MGLVGLKKCFLFLISVKGHCVALLFLKLNIHHDYRYINISPTKETSFLRCSSTHNPTWAGLKLPSPNVNK